MKHKDLPRGAAVKGCPSSKWKTCIKKVKARSERRRAKQDPEVVPCYGRYPGYDD